MNVWNITQTNMFLFSLIRSIPAFLDDFLKKKNCKETLKFYIRPANDVEY